MSAPSVVDEVMSSFWVFDRTAGPRSDPIETSAPDMVPVSYPKSRPEMAAVEMSAQT